MSSLQLAISTLRVGVRTLSYHLYSVYLFTRSDVKTIIIPNTVFGCLSALSASTFGIDTSTLPPFSFVSLLLTMIWVWINILPENIDNQRSTHSIEEDKLNKPWRPIASGRLTQTQAKWLMLCSYAAAAGLSWRLGGLKQCIGLMVSGFWYNDLGGANSNPIIRNFIVGIGYACFTSGATEVALGSSMLPASFWKWIVMLAVVITTTIHAQDMPDQEGDSLRRRRTMPLVFGDFPSRVSLAVTTIFWSLSCSRSWDLGLLSGAPSVALACLVAFRTLMLRDVRSDKMTYLIYNGWLTSIFVLPVMKTYAGTV